MTTALTVGCFDLLHRGHLNLIARMSEMADRVLVLVHDDSSIEVNKSRTPVQPLQERLDAVRRLGVDARPVFTADPSGALRALLSRTTVDVFVRGDDWSEFPGRPVIEQAGIPIVLVPYTPGVSTTILREAM